MAYRRAEAAAYAARWWNGFNPAYRRMHGNDCTNFISQCLAAGGLKQVGGTGRHQGWWYRHANEGWSYSWAVADALARYLRGLPEVTVKGSAKELAVGDIIAYDWNGDGRFQHTTIVTGLSSGGEPLVSAHSQPSHLRPWRYLDSPAFSPKTSYLFLAFE